MAPRVPTRLPQRGERESVENPTVAWARKQGIYAVKLQGQGNRSLPDRIFFVPGGKPVLIEFKAPGKLPSPLQEIAIAKFQDYGYDVQVFDNALDAIKYLKHATPKPLYDITKLNPVKELFEWAYHNLRGDIGACIEFERRYKELFNE